MEFEKLKPGKIIVIGSSRNKILIEKVEYFNDYVRIVGTDLSSRIYDPNASSNSIFDRIFSKEELEKIQIISLESDFKGDPHKVFVALEEKRYRFASLYDPILAVNISKVDPLPHQLEAVYGRILKLPRIRFLIADDPGAGKTIMAGLIIKELKLRKLINRILIVVPGHLKDQWLREMKEHFEEDFVIVNREYLNSRYENIWQKENQIIASMDFLKQEDILKSLEDVFFDLVIVDEAHKLSASQYGKKTYKTDRYKLGEILARNSEHLLFLTATPHSGDADRFRLFLDLLKPGFFANDKMIKESIENRDNPLFIRRLKEDFKDFEGKPLFPEREVKTIQFSLSNEEKILYNHLSQYVNEQYNKALAKDKNNNLAFALVIFQRRFASSVYALLKSLERRKKRLENLKKEKSNNSNFEDSEKLSEIFEEIEDEEEIYRWKEEEKMETLVFSKNEELDLEIKTIDQLIEEANHVLNLECEQKLTQLKKTFEELNEKYPGKKIIIFTESKDTLEYLDKKIKEWGYSTVTIHGSMSLQERIEAEKIFKNEKQVLIATEAAGEGINLQFCNLMINYDIPWNPNRLEQRMGRIHRYGQREKVFIFNLVAQDTREGEVLIRLFNKLNDIRQALGNDRVFDVIGEVFIGKDLRKLLIEAAAGSRKLDDIIKEMEFKVDKEYIERIKDDLDDSLAYKYIDYTFVKEICEKAKENKLIPEYIERFFKKAFEILGGKIRDRKDGFFSIEFIPFELKKRIEKQSNVSFNKVTFDKTTAFKNPDSEFITFGHYLFEALMQHIEENFEEDLKRGAVFFDPEGKLDGYILFYEGEILDGFSKVVGKKLFSLFVSEKEIKLIDPSIIWTLVPGYSEEETPIDPNDNNIFSIILKEVEKYQQEKYLERKKDAEIKKKYGVESLKMCITEIIEKILESEQRKERGENVEGILKKYEMKHEEYIKRLKDLEKEIEMEQLLSKGTPLFVGMVRVKPKKPEYDFMKSDERIEKLAMEEAIKYELSQGREPEDVSVQNLGFDIRSKDKNGNFRYIEVKGRVEEGDIALTVNEWIKAQRFGDDYYLYVVYNCGTKPELKIIQNPAKKFKPQEQMEIVRYVIPEEQIKEEENNG